MLTLKRKAFESIMIRIPGRENPVVVKVISAIRGAAKLSFEADGDIIILREELDGNPTHTFRQTG